MHFHALPSLLALTAAATLTACASAPVAPDVPPAPPAADPAIAALQPAVDRILAHAQADRGAFALLVELCDDIGHRLSGSASLDKAIAWAVASLQAAGHEQVRTEAVTVPRWVRGAESLHLVEGGAPQALAMLALGGSIGTPAGGIQGEVLVVANEADLAKAGVAAKGRIVLFNHKMPPWTEQDGARYGPSVKYRIHGPRLAAQAGASAVLVRSVTAHGLQTPHTGQTRYAADVPLIPAAAVTGEAADLLERLQVRGKKPVVRLTMAARMDGTAPSANVIAELRGREKPDEIVVIGGHLDSWDVGQGAHDDGAGCVMAMQALTVLRKLDLRPRRTIRVVLWTNEENGLAGGKQYAIDHKAELANHVAALEADSGGFRPVSVGIDMDDKAAQKVAEKQLAALLTLLQPMAKMLVIPDECGADVSPLKALGVAAMELYTHGERYFDTHHTAADTVDKVDPVELAQSTAAMAAVAYVLAEWPGRLGK